MYSYEDRLRAVRLYIKLGKRVRLTIRQLGYPTKNALKSWHREFEKRDDLPTVSGDPIVVLFSRFESRRFLRPYSSAEIF